MTACVIKSSENPEKIFILVALEAGMFSSGAVCEDARIIDGNSGGPLDRAQKEHF
jgi:hypothetical protein